MRFSEKGVEDEEDLYDCVYDDEDGGEIYEDLMKTEAIAPPVSPPFLLVFLLFKFSSFPYPFVLVSFLASTFIT